MKKLNLKHFKIAKLVNPQSIFGGDTTIGDGGGGTIIVGTKPKCKIETGSEVYEIAG